MSARIAGEVRRVEMKTVKSAYIEMATVEQRNRALQENRRLILPNNRYAVYVEMRRNYHRPAARRRSSSRGRDRVRDHPLNRVLPSYEDEERDIRDVRDMDVRQSRYSKSK